MMAKNFPKMLPPDGVALRPTRPDLPKSDLSAVGSFFKNYFAPLYQFPVAGAFVLGRLYNLDPPFRHSYGFHKADCCFWRQNLPKPLFLCVLGTDWTFFCD